MQWQQDQAHSSNEACSPTKKHLLDIFGAGPDLESEEVEYTEVEVSTLDPHRGNKLSGLYGYVLGACCYSLMLVRY